MSEFDRFEWALAWTESRSVETAWGDGGMACGRWQMHPAWYAEWADPAIQVGWSWDDAFRAALRRFWDEYQRQGIEVRRRAMIFHLGGSATARGEWDEAYAERFTTFWMASSLEFKA